MILNSIIAIIASLGFGIIFNIKGKKLIFASIGGGIGWLTYSLTSTLNISDVFALFLSAIVISFYSEIFARILKTPVTTYIVCALIPLVPGAGMYYTMFEIISGNLEKAISIGINTLSSAGALSLGVILLSTITRQTSSFLIKRKNNELKK
jgi:uncharacterized membrane protein YjjB (DUF3815 family)